MKTFQYQCSFCDKKYKREKPFNDHVCEEMIRSHEIKTPEGMRAYSYYKLWLKIRHHSTATETTFIASSHYKAFMRFEKFARNIRLPLPEQYIKLMTDKTLMPSMWTDNLAYKKYTEYMDRRMAPMKQVWLTLKTMDEYCSKNAIDISEYYDNMEPNEFVRCLVRRQISPWILYNSPKFVDYYYDVFNSAHRKTYDQMHPPSDWNEKFKKHKEKVKEIRSIINELDL